MSWSTPYLCELKHTISVWAEAHHICLSWSKPYLSDLNQTYPGTIISLCLEFLHKYVCVVYFFQIASSLTIPFQPFHACYMSRSSHISYFDRAKITDGYELQFSQLSLQSQIFYSAPSSLQENYSYLCLLQYLKKVFYRTVTQYLKKVFYRTVTPCTYFA